MQKSQNEELPEWKKRLKEAEEKLRGKREPKNGV